jgi:hypothetical protein
MSTHLTLLQHQFDVAQKLIKDQMETIQLLKVQQRELQEEVDAWRAHAQASHNWFRTDSLPGARQRFYDAEDARHPYYLAAIDCSTATTAESTENQTTNDPTAD